MTASTQAAFSLPLVLSELVIMIIGNSQINTINTPTIERAKPDFSIILFFQFLREPLYLICLLLGL